MKRKSCRLQGLQLVIVSFIKSYFYHKCVFNQTHDNLTELDQQTQLYSISEQ